MKCIKILYFNIVDMKVCNGVQKCLYLKTLKGVFKLLRWRQNFSEKKSILGNFGVNPTSVKLRHM